MEKDCIPWKGTHAGALNEKQPLGRTHVGEIPVGPSLLWRDPSLEQAKRVRSPPPEEEGAAETKCDELTAAPFPCTAQAGGIREFRRKVKAREK